MEQRTDQRLVELESRVKHLEGLINKSNIPVDESPPNEFNLRELFSSFFELFNQLSKSLLQISELIHVLSKEEFSLSKEVHKSLRSGINISSFDSIRLHTKTSIPNLDLEDLTFEKLNFPVNRILLNLDHDARKVGDILKRQQEILKEELNQIAPDVRRQAEANIRFKYYNDGESTRNDIFE